jgi:hypothetical protein
MIRDVVSASCATLGPMCDPYAAPAEFYELLSGELRAPSSAPCRPSLPGLILQLDPSSMLEPAQAWCSRQV